MRKMLSLLATTSAAALLLAGCTTPTADPSSAGPADICGSTEPAEITFVNTVTESMTADVYQVMVDRFTEACPQVSVEMITPPTADRDAFVKQLLAAGTFPDVHDSLQPDLFKDQLHTWDLDDPDLAVLQNKDRMLQDGELYQLGTRVVPWNVIFYNKDLFAQAGVTEVPTTREEFKAVMDKLKDAEITPLATAGEWVTGLTMTILFPIFAENECWYGQRQAGEVSFSDQNWLDAATEFKAWSDEGYFNDGPLGIGYTQLQQLFFGGEVAMYPMGGWIASETTDFNSGVFPMPTENGAGPLDGSIGSVGFTVSNSSEYPEQAQAFAKFLAFNPENHRDTLQYEGGLSNLDLGDARLPLELTPLNAELQQFIDDAPSFNTAFNGQGDCSLVPGTQELIVQQAQAIIAGTATPEEALKAIDEFWDRGGNS